MFRFFLTILKIIFIQDKSQTVLQYLPFSFSQCNIHGNSLNTQPLRIAWKYVTLHHPLFSSRVRPVFISHGFPMPGWRVHFTHKLHYCRTPVLCPDRW